VPPEPVRSQASLARLVAVTTFVVLTAQSAAAQLSPAFEDLNLSTPSSVVQGAGARAFGMGGAFLARADDATAASWNPAGLSYLSRPELSLVGAHSGFESATKDSLGAPRRTDVFSGTSPDFVSAAYPIRLGSTSGSVQLGFQRIITFAGDRVLDRKDYDFTMETRGGFDTLSAGIGLRLFSRLRAGFTVNRWFNGFTETRERSGNRPSIQEVDFKISGWNVNAGLIGSPIENVNIGLVYKSAFTGDCTLWRRRTDGGVVIGQHESKDVTLDFPAALGAGVSWRPFSPLTFSADYTQTFWSQGQIHNYFVLPDNGTPETYDSLPYPRLTTPQLQHDTAQWRFGIEYVIVGDSISLPFRAGYFDDRQLFEGLDGHAPGYGGYTVGIGVIFGPALFDIAYVRERGAYREGVFDPQPNETRVSTHRLLASLILRLGGH
jgi:hypothetical protein